MKSGKKKRFCCWCGKVETTELCQDKGLKKSVARMAKEIKKNLKDNN